MKIKLSKTQWESIGNETGWIKTSQNEDFELSPDMPVPDEYEELQQIRRDLTETSRKLERLTISNNLEVKMIANRWMNELDRIRQAIFNYDRPRG